MVAQRLFPRILRTEDEDELPKTSPYCGSTMKSRAARRKSRNKSSMKRSSHWWIINRTNFWYWGLFLFVVVFLLCLSSWTLNMEMLGGKEEFDLTYLHKTSAAGTFSTGNNKSTIRIHDHQRELQVKPNIDKKTSPLLATETIRNAATVAPSARRIQKEIQSNITIDSKHASANTIRRTDKKMIKVAGKSTMHFQTKRDNSKNKPANENHPYFLTLQCLQEGIRRSLTIPQTSNNETVLTIPISNDPSGQQQQRQQTLQHNNNNNIQSKRHFRFQSYASKLFAKLRRDNLGISTETFLQSLASNNDAPYLSFQPNSGSSSTFFFTNDELFLIKTVDRKHVHTLTTSFLSEYYMHLVKNPNSLLYKIVGVFRVQVDGQKSVYFLVSRNVFDPKLPVSKKFDIKGRKDFRRISDTKEKKKVVPVLKDLDFLKSGIKLHMDEKKADFLHQLEADTKLLQSLGSHDYSLLIGIYIRQSANPTNKDANNDNVPFSLDDKTLRSILRSRDNSLLTTYEHLDENGRIQELYFLAIIDIFETPSSIDFLLYERRPRQYAERLHQFVAKHVVD